MRSSIRKWSVVPQFILRYAWRPSLRFVLQPILRLIRRATRWDGFWWIVAMVVVLAVGVLLSWRFWGELHGEQDSLSTTIRNQGLLIGGVIGILLALWRSKVAERQTATAQQSLLNDQYQRAADMLGNSALTVRMGGVNVLRHLAEDHPEQYHIRVMELFCAFVRHPTSDPAFSSLTGMLREDVQAVMTAIGSRSELGLEYEKVADFHLQLLGAVLDYADLREANLAGADLRGASLYSASLSEANLSGAALVRADLAKADAKRANLCWANLSNARLEDTHISGAVFQEEVADAGPSLLLGYPVGMTLHARLTAQQLRQARADPKNPPILNDVVDTDSGLPLIWEGNTLER